MNKYVIGIRKSSMNNAETVSQMVQLALMKIGIKDVEIRNVAGRYSEKIEEEFMMIEFVRK